MAEHIEEEAEAKWFKRFLTLFLISLIMIAAGVIIMAAAAALSPEAGASSFGGVIFIWFFPIVFGVGPEAHWLILFAIILAILGLIMLIVTRRMAERTLQS
ncbi:MAG: DUF131 domain-containing protein [Candidatus Bathyarchaeia archaeon]|nr:hypothetical protein [Candidatus Bathyarchaeota archaeon]